MRTVVAAKITVNRAIASRNAAQLRASCGGSVRGTRASPTTLHRPMITAARATIAAAYRLLRRSRSSPPFSWSLMPHRPAKAGEIDS
ncbi:hypothetical protein BJF79_20680 [Actinomadura sp. CNU-125]|nr:hypothetical protein BJF79_20680 [Actinomadura sp. CNU-125]